MSVLFTLPIGALQMHQVSLTALNYRVDLVFLKKSKGHNSKAVGVKGFILCTFREAL